MYIMSLKFTDIFWQGKQLLQATYWVIAALVLNGSSLIEATKL